MPPTDDKKNRPRGLLFYLAICAIPAAFACSSSDGGGSGGTAGTAGAGGSGGNTGGASGINPLDGIGPDQLRIRQLLARMEGIEEVILATDPDVEGDATALYLARLLKPLGVSVSRLAHGIAVGTEIEYADRVSLLRALENRRPL